MDLTKERYNLLKMARGKINTSLTGLYTKDQLKNLPHRNKVFAYPNINCDLKIRAGDKLYSFDREEELADILDQFFQAD